MNLTYRYRVKNLEGELNRQARAVSYVWNYLNDVQRQALKWDRKWPSAFGLTYLVAGAGKELGLPGHTVAQVCHQYARSRRQHGPWLRWRGRRSLGWVPLRADSIKRQGDAFRIGGMAYRVFNPRPLPTGKICDGSGFSQDRRGNWFINIVVEITVPSTRAPANGVGVDLGLKELVALSTGETVSNPRHLRVIAERLGKAQRARKKRLATNLHARAANARRDHLHKLSTRLVRRFDYIAVGNVNAAGLAKTSMAKSVYDASWSTLRTMLAYKAITHGASYQEVDERFSSQVCSACGCLPASRPRGIADLGIREWACSDCGAVHDRDVNAARNILRSGRRAPAVGAAARASETSTPVCAWEK